MQTVTVAIPTYRRERVLVETIEQVLAQSPGADEVLIVDQTPCHEPETNRFLETEAAAGRLRWLRQSPPSLPAARNRALREAHGDVVLFIDDDVLLEPGFVEQHRSNYENATVVAVGGRVVQARTGWMLPRAPQSWPRDLDFLYFRFDSSPRTVGIANFSGGNHSVRRAYALETGGYDEAYIGWAFREETDLALRIWRRGGIIVFDPVASLTHLQAPAGGCRFEEASTPDWVIAFPGTYFAFRNLFPSVAFWREILFTSFTGSVLRMSNARRPWRLPWAVLSYAYAVVRAARAAARTKRSDRERMKDARP